LLENLCLVVYKKIVKEIKQRGDMPVNTEYVVSSGQYEGILSQTANLDEILIQIAQSLGIADRQFTKQEIEKARGELSPMNDRVATVTFSENKNNHIITGIVNFLRKIHNVATIPPIENTWVQKLSLPDVLGRGMVADMISEGWLINVATEIQKGSQADFAVRGTLSSSNIMRRQFKKGDDYGEVPDTIGVFILGFELPELEHRKEFVSRLVRAEYESKKYFLPDKYSDYYIELPKMGNWKKEDLPEVYHELWDLCVILRTKIKDQDEVIKMHAVQTPLALNLASEVKRVVAPDTFVNDAMKREQGLLELQTFLNKQKQKGKEEMLIMAIQTNVPNEALETMRQRAEITESRLAELKKQAQMT
jgi:hypothetical protein